jgi:hypothetical protein
MAGIGPVEERSLTVKNALENLIGDNECNFTLHAGGTYTREQAEEIL